MRLAAALILLVATTAHAQTPTTALAQLAADSAKLHRIERMCLWIVLSPFAEQPILSKHVVSSTPLEGETADDAATRACAALAATVRPDKTSLTLYCASCETAAPEVTP